MVILVIGVLLFGSRLPEVGRSLGKGLMEFKKGVAGVEDDDKRPGVTETEAQKSVAVERDDAAAPKFEAPAEDDTAKA